MARLKTGQKRIQNARKISPQVACEAGFIVGSREVRDRGGLIRRPSLTSAWAIGYRAAGEGRSLEEALQRVADR